MELIQESSLKSDFYATSSDEMSSIVKRPSGLISASISNMSNYNNNNIEPLRLLKFQIFVDQNRGH